MGKFKEKIESSQNRKRFSDFKKIMNGLGVLSSANYDTKEEGEIIAESLFVDNNHFEDWMTEPIESLLDYKDNNPYPSEETDCYVLEEIGKIIDQYRILKEFRFKKQN